MEVQLYKNDMEADRGRLQASSNDETKRENEAQKECKRSFLFKKSARVQFVHRPDDSENVRNLRYQPDGAIAKELQAPKPFEFPQS